MSDRQEGNDTRTLCIYVCILYVLRLGHCGEV